MTLTYLETVESSALNTERFILTTSRLFAFFFAPEFLFRARCVALASCRGPVGAAPQPVYIGLQSAVGIITLKEMLQNIHNLAEGITAGFEPATLIPTLDYSLGVLLLRHDSVHWISLTNLNESR